MYNEEIERVIARMAEVAGYLWQRGWAERNGGNISCDITEWADDSMTQSGSSYGPFALGRCVDRLRGASFLVTGTNRRMRYVASAPMENASIIRIGDDGLSYRIVSGEPIRPTSELPAHLAIHNYLRSAERTRVRTVLHTHPTDLIAMTHNPAFLQKDRLGTLLWSMIPETRAFCPKGLGIVPYELPGSERLADRTIEQLGDYDVVMWEKHGALAVGEDPVEAFDMIDTLSKSAQIYLTARAMGFEPTGMTAGQMDEMKEAFGL